MVISHKVELFIVGGLKFYCLFLFFFSNQNKT